MRFSAFLLLMSVTPFVALGCSEDKDDGGDTKSPDSDRTGFGGSPTGDGDGEGGNGDERNLCDFGDDAEKCGPEDSVACTPVLDQTDRACNSDDDCGSDELCFESDDAGTSAGLCMAIVGECLAVDGEQTGKFGESCESDADCGGGTCVEVSETESECEDYCRVGAASGCGEKELEGSGVECAYFAYNLEDIGAEQGAGDVGICAHLCNCDDDCPGAQRCFPDESDGFAGVCTGGLMAEDGIPCEDGMGGAGGQTGN